MAKTNKTILIISLIAYLIVGLSVFLMMFNEPDAMGSLNSSDYILGGIFWVCLLLGSISQIILTVKVKHWKNDNFEAIEMKRTHLKPGVISFFKNVPGIVSDLVFVVSLITFIITNVVSNGTGIACYLSLSLAIFSFCSHCIFNGKNYYYISNHRIIEKMQKKMTEVSL